MLRKHLVVLGLSIHVEDPADNDSYEVTERSKVRRNKDRGAYDRNIVHAILDEALVAHVGFVKEERPCVLPMIYARVNETLYLHGSITNAMLKATKNEMDICVTVTLLDGLAVARSAFHHSVNYRSVVAYGKAHAVTDEEEKLTALNAITEHALPGRLSEIRDHSKAEKNSTLVLSLELKEVSAKIRTGHVKDDEKDYRNPNIWAGILPFQKLTALEPIDDVRLLPGVAKPKSVTHYTRPKT